MPERRTPRELYEDLFEEVQTRHVFSDSKTFVDAVPKSRPGRILDRFRAEREAPGFDLETFVATHFDLPDEPGAAMDADGESSVRRRIETLWNALTRAADRSSPGSTLIDLPHPYVVPGGRFREVYYWDSYFTMLGLAASGRREMVENMVGNFAYLIDEIGFIPNGNRSYYCTRSQPPFFALMVELLAEVREDQDVFLEFLPQLLREYGFWMDGRDELGSESGATRRVVAVPGGVLNRYWDDCDRPREESYAEDLALYRARAGIGYREIRAACESGWDFSSRWLVDAHSMRTIATTDVIPIDLNALMWKLEDTLAHSLERAGEGRRAARFEEHANARRRLIQSRFFDDDEGVFVDLELGSLGPTGVESLAMAYPLYFGLATDAQARRVAARLEMNFLSPGGWVTTLNTTGQQWDSPNGWAPLQWIVYSALRGAGFSELALEGARRWVDNNLLVYRRHGRLLEKYDVETVGHIAEGGEYLVQDGFGWTNAILVLLMDELGLAHNR